MHTIPTVNFPAFAFIPIMNTRGQPLTPNFKPLSKEEHPMKYAMIATLMLFSAFASAQGNSKNGLTDASQVSAGQHLDIAKVISLTHDADNSGGCNPVGTHLKYQDSTGVTHTLNYKAFAAGDVNCQNG